MDEHFDQRHVSSLSCSRTGVVEVVASEGASNAVLLYIIFDLFLDLGVVVGDVFEALS